MSAAVIIALQKKYVRKFQESGAFDIKSARSLEELGLKDRHLFRRMVSRGVFIPAPNNKFYIDKDALELFEARRRKIMLAILFVVLIVMIWAIFFQSKLE